MLPASQLTVNNTQPTLAVSHRNNDSMSLRGTITCQLTGRCAPQEELRLAAKAQAVVATAVVASKQSVAEEGLPMMEGTQLASHGSAAMAALTHGTDQAPCPDAVILEGQGTMVVHHDVPATDAITGMLNVDRQAPDPALPNDEMKPLENGRATRHRPASQSEDGSGGMSHTQVSAFFDSCATGLDSAV